MFSYIHRTSVLCTIIRNICKTTTDQKFDGYWQHILSNCENALTQPSTISKETWENVRKDLESQCDPSSLDFIILDIFQRMNYPDAGISYYKFLRDNNYKPTIPIITKYLQLYSIKYDPISETDKKHILSLYDNINKQYTSLSEYLSNAFIECFCKMDKWEEAIKIIDRYEKNDKTLLRSGYSKLISYFFDHKNEKLGYEYLVQSLQRGLGPYNSTYATYLQYCLEGKGTFNIKVEKLFLLWSMYGIKPSKYIAFQYMNACMKNGWSVSETTVSKSRCSICKEDISRQSLSDKDYKRLLEGIKKKLIFNKMYYVTYPQEIQTYIDFIDKTKPYDIVIDGLNIMYILRRHIGRKLIPQVVRTFKSYEKQNKKVLIIGKQHIKNFILEIGLKVANYFLVENESKDDLFLLYAAFASGENAKVVSMDLMRQHIFALQDIELNVLFKKWQLSHQFSFDLKNGCVQLNAHNPIDAIVEKHNDNWHIPYVTSGETSRMRHTNTTHWLCLKMR